MKTSHVKNSIPYSQFLRLRRLCSDDSDFISKLEEISTPINFMFLLHFDVICDLLLNRRTEKWNLFVK